MVKWRSNNADLPVSAEAVNQEMLEMLKDFARGIGRKREDVEFLIADAENVPSPNLPAILDAAAKLPEFPEPENAKGPKPAAGPWQDSRTNPPPKDREIWATWPYQIFVAVAWSPSWRAWVGLCSFKRDTGPDFWAELYPPEVVK